MKLVISFDVHNDLPTIRSRVPGLSMWFIVVHAENATERISIEMENQSPCNLISFRELIMAKLNEAAGELSPITEGGYRIYQKKAPNVQIR